MDRPFWFVFLSIAIIGSITWLAIFEHNYHPRVQRYNEDVIILQVGESELDFNHPPGAFSILRQSEDGSSSLRIGVTSITVGRHMMALVRCDRHRTRRGTKHTYVEFLRPVGFPNTAAICGRPGCEEPGLVSLTQQELDDYEAGQRVFPIFTHSAKVRVE